MDVKFEEQRALWKSSGMSSSTVKVQEEQATKVESAHIPLTMVMQIGEQSKQANQRSR